MLVSFWTPILLFISIAPAGNIGNCSCAILPSYPQRQGLCKSQLRLIPFSSPQPRSWGDIRRSEIISSPRRLRTRPLRQRNRRLPHPQQPRHRLLGQQAQLLRTQRQPHRLPKPLPPRQPSRTLRRQRVRRHFHASYPRHRQRRLRPIQRHHLQRPHGLLTRPAPTLSHRLLDAHPLRQDQPRHPAQPPRRPQRLHRLHILYRRRLGKSRHRRLAVHQRSGAGHPRPHRRRPRLRRTPPPPTHRLMRAVLNIH